MPNLKLTAMDSYRDQPPERGGRELQNKKGSSSKHIVLNERKLKI
jgi:hypothetical protein